MSMEGVGGQKKPISCQHSFFTTPCLVNTVCECPLTSTVVDKKNFMKNAGPQIYKILKVWRLETPKPFYNFILSQA